ncbi:MAG: hypothetical protein K2X93_24680 [Candidatus Obscuribacterales bacterium]|nr:hypothetical protein [Candidatus Obscuribacterales bacterium]
MSTTNGGEPQELPIGFKAAYEQLEKKGGRRTFSNMRFRMLNVYGLYVQARYRSGLMRNPKRNHFLRWFTEPEYVETSIRDLSDLYIDGVSSGRLHGNSEGSALAIQQMLAKPDFGPVNLIVSGHFTESGWFVDSVEIEPRTKPA